MPEPGTIFSGSMGTNVFDAATGVPHGSIRTTTAGQIRHEGGSVILAPELTRSGLMNWRHVNITEGGISVFGDLIDSMVPKILRIK